VAMSRYQPLPRWRWRLPSRRTVGRVAMAAASLAFLVTSLPLGYYGYQNWRGQQAWRAFQASLKRSGESLSFTALLPQAVPDSADFARLPAFRSFMSPTNVATAELFQRMRPFELPTSVYQVNAVLLDWSRQSAAPLDTFASPARQSAGGGSGKRRRDDAVLMLQELQAQTENLRDLGAAAARFDAFQTSAKRDPEAVFRPDREPILALERLHVLLQARACAFLALGRNAEAAEDLLAGFHLARLARRIPDTRSTFRVQLLLARSMQPLWEGLSQHAWSEPQLAAFQRELAGFNLLADYTNAVRRVVLAHIELWRAIPDSTNSYLNLPANDGDYISDSAWLLQPRAWWFDNCIQLHQAGRIAADQVDVSGGRVHTDSALVWSDLNGLPLDAPTRELLQQPSWFGTNPSIVTFAQTSVNQALVACALERFRLANGAYPETLEALVPALLERIPHDVVSGRPLVYQALGDGNLILRGVGPNGTDDRKNKTCDDWLWTYSTNSPGTTLF